MSPTPSSDSSFEGKSNDSPSASSNEFDTSPLHTQQQLNYFPGFSLPLTETSGRYEKMRHHADGGMGSVFLAKDKQFHRSVAFKEIKHQWVSYPQATIRFVFEAEVTGKLEHPGIVPVYSLGQNPDGTPYYAMRFIQGETLSEAIQQYHAFESEPSQKNLQFRQLLKRFIDVCNTMAYAHSRGYLHRDIKPSNIMIGGFGETLIVDWGLAKFIGKSKSDGPTSRTPFSEPVSSSTDAQTIHELQSTNETEIGRVVGTPQYMSPEQAKGEWDQVDERSDIFSLGCLLYQILTGKAPYQGYSSTDILSQASEVQYRLPNEIVSVPKALNAIVCKSMSKNREDRYPNAQLLAQDVENWLGDEPVKAYPEPWIARIRRWGRKHRSLVTALSALIVTATIGLTIGIVLVDQQRSRAETAEKESKESLLLLAEEQKKTKSALDRVLEEQEKTKLALEKARSRFQLSLETFNDMIFAIQDKLDTRPGTHDLKTELLQRAQKGLQKLLEEKEEGIRTDKTQMWSYFRLGDVALLLGNTKEALDQYQRGHQIAKEWFEEDERDPQSRREMAVSFDKLGDALLKQGDAPSAQKYYFQSLTHRQSLVDSDGQNLQSLRDLSVSLEKIGNIQEKLGDPLAALKNYRNSLAISRRISEREPNRTEIRTDLAISLDKVGDIYLEIKDLSTAENYFQEGLSIRQKLLASDPKNIELQRNVSISLDRLGTVFWYRSDWPVARKHYQESLAIRQKLALADPQNYHAQRDLSVSFDKLGNLELELGNPMLAMQYYQSSLKIAQTLAQADPQNAQVHRDIIVCYSNFADVEQKLRHFAEGEKWIRQAIQVVESFSRPAFFKEERVVLNYRGMYFRYAQKSLVDPNAILKFPDDQDRPQLLVEVMEALIEKKQAKKATQCADLFVEHFTETNRFFDAAKVYARCIPLVTLDFEKEILGQKSVEYLQEAIERGWKNLAQLQNNSDWDSLRQRKDFQKVRNDLITKFSSGRELLPRPKEP